MNKIIVTCVYQYKLCELTIYDSRKSVALKVCNSRNVYKFGIFFMTVI